MKTSSPITRRKFLGQSCCSAIGSASLLSTIFNLRLINAAAAVCNPPSSFADYKALVCFFQLGGNDSFNMLAPRTAAGHNDYLARRGGLGLPLTDPGDGTAWLRSLTLDGGTTPELNNWNYGVHSSMPKLRTLFNTDRKAAFVANVGTLVDPVADINELNNLGSKQVPLGLYSHSDQIQHWQTATPQSRAAIGWGGRVADILNTAAVGSSPIKMNIGVGGSNYFLSGNDITPYTINSGGAIALDSYTGAPYASFRNAVTNIVNASYANLLERTYAAKRKVARDAFEQFSSAVQPLTDESLFDAADSDLADQLRMVARIIKARDALGAKRQVFFVSMGGWDHHDEVLNNQLGMLGVVDNAVDAFYRTTAGSEMNIANNVTLFSCSDFGRTLSSNGNGSDHAWGGNVFVVGGSVKGGKIYGKFPLLAEAGNLLDTGRGRFIPTTGVDQYGAELATWFGVPTGDCLSSVFPNLPGLGGMSALADFLT